MNRLHDNIVGNLQYMDNKTSQGIKLSEETNDMIKKMKSELKEDFNNYANKVKSKKRISSSACNIFFLRYIENSELKCYILVQPTRSK